MRKKGNINETTNAAFKVVNEQSHEQWTKTGWNQKATTKLNLVVQKYTIIKVKYVFSPHKLKKIMIRFSFLSR